MGLFHKTHQKHAVPRPHWKALRGARSRLRICRIEQMESRQLLSVSPSPIHVGATYFEDSNDFDASSALRGTATQVADLIEVSFTGGADGTQLAELRIDTNNTFFDINSTSPGAYGSFPLTILKKDGFEITSFSVVDGGTQLLMTFSGFTAGDILVFSIDVDEQGNLQPNAVAEGAEFEGATLTASFTASHMYELTSPAIIFYDDFDLAGTGLEETLPNNNYNNWAAQDYVPENSSQGPVYTAGAHDLLQQTPLPITLSGYVFEDVDADNVRQPGESGIGGVQLTLLELIDGSYVATGKTATTDADGFYEFEGLLPGTYRVVETQPSGYLSVGDTPGKVDGVTRGVVTSVDILSGINLEGGENSVHNDFAETLPAELSGHVYHDANNNGIRDFFGEDPIANVHLVVENVANHTTYDAYTDADGYWSVGDLMPGEYKVTEYQPDGYLDGLDIEGTAGGLAHNPGDLIDGVYLVGGQSGIDYDFGELKSGCISGYVYVDANNNGVYDEGETPIEGVTLTLLDADGNPTGETRVTDEKGFYRFCGLVPGAYAVQETQPEPYYDGLDKEGTAGGFANNPGDLIDSIPLGSGVKATNYNFGELEPVSISGKVFIDLDDDNTWDAGEQLYAGVTIYLLDGSGNRIRSTPTGSDGTYSFTNLPPGVYGVEEALTPDYIEGGNQVGSAGGTLNAPNQVLAINLISGTEGINYDFWEVQLTIISGRVFQDGPAIVINEGDPEPDILALRDGRWTPDDTPLSGITLILCDGTGVPLQYYNASMGDWVNITTTTASDGTYQFVLNDYQLYYSDVYTIRQLRPSDYTPGIATAGSNDGKVYNKYAQPNATEANQWDLIIDPLGVNGFDPTGMKSASITQIFVDPGDHAAEYNFSEVVVQVETTPPEDPKFPSYDPPPNPSTPLTPPPPQPYSEYRFIGMPYTIPQVIIPLMAGGSGGPGGYSWHLSIIDAGQPRRIGAGDRFTQYPQNTLFDPVSWSGASVDQSQFVLADENGAPIRTVRFGITGATPVAGDWNGDGVSKVGVFIDGLWFLDLNGNGAWDEVDLWAKLGKKGDQPVSGDWDGDGKADIGIFGPAWIGDLKAISVEPGLPDAQNLPIKSRPKNVPPEPSDAAVGWRTMKKGNAGRMRSDVIDHVFEYGTKGDRAVVGDWNGDGIRTVGIFRNGAWFLDMDGDGRWSEGDVTVDFGQEGDLPVVGDWTGDGVSKLGVYRNGTFYLDTNNNRQLDATDKVFQLGQAGDLPVAGDWTGDGVDKVGVYEQNAPAEPQTASAGSTAPAAAVK